MKTIKLFVLSAIILLLSGCACCTGEPDYPQNLHKVNDTIYRSGQPDNCDFQTLIKVYGIKSVINLREYHTDQDDIGALPLQLFKIPLAAGSITENDLIIMLKTIKKAPKPVLIHCWHGSDRTGTAVASSRIVFENWEVERAIAELKEDKYGHHEFIYRNITRLLKNADWKRIRQEVNRP